MINPISVLLLGYLVASKCLNCIALLLGVEAEEFDPTVSKRNIDQKNPRLLGCYFQV